MKTLKLWLLVIVVGIGLGLSVLAAYTHYKRIKAENSRLSNNLEYYQGRLSTTDSKNIVLQHTIEELESSQDSLVQKINLLSKRLKLKPKEVRTVVCTETIIRDTIHDTIPVTPNFSATLHPNNQTSIEVIRTDSLLTVVPDIRNEQTIFIYTEEKYKYKCWFSRLIHFNFKKTRKNKYVIENSNDLIKTGESRVINIVD